MAVGGMDDSSMGAWQLRDDREIVSMRGGYVLVAGSAGQPLAPRFLVGQDTLRHGAQPP